MEALFRAPSDAIQPAEATPSAAPELAIDVHGLGKSYAGAPAVNGIDLAIRRGEVFALLGPNGAGKTTTVEILEGYRTRDQGNVSVLGLDPGRDRGRLKSRVGIVLQSTQYRAIAHGARDGRQFRARRWYSRGRPTVSRRAVHQTSMTRPSRARNGHQAHLASLALVRRPLWNAPRKLAHAGELVCAEASVEDLRNLIARLSAESESERLPSVAPEVGRAAATATEGSATQNPQSTASVDVSTVATKPVAASFSGDQVTRHLTHRGIDRPHRLRGGMLPAAGGAALAVTACGAPVIHGNVGLDDDAP
jgi:hypothetical protein